MANEHARLARSILDNSTYMTLATADASGVPWATPVWYAAESHNSLIWISRPDARHSQNLTVRPQLGIVIFDCHAPIGTGQGVYFEATAESIGDNDVEAAMATFSRWSLAQGGRAFSADDVRGSAPHRLYRARVSRAYLGDKDRRIPVEFA